CVRLALVQISKWFSWSGSSAPASPVLIVDNPAKKIGYFRIVRRGTYRSIGLHLLRQANSLAHPQAFSAIHTGFHLYPDIHPPSGIDSDPGSAAGAPDFVLATAAVKFADHQNRPRRLFSVLQNTDQSPFACLDQKFLSSVNAFSST